MKDKMGTYYGLETPQSNSTDKRPNRYRLTKIILIIIVVVLIIYGLSTNISSSSGHASDDDAPNVHFINSTLGFQKIYAIELPSRLDRVNALKIQGAILGLDIDAQSAIDIKSFAAKNYTGLTPSSGKLLNENFKDGEYACFQAHVQILRKIVEENLTSALIIEGDALFDLNIKQILADTMNHMPKLTKMGPYKFIETDRKNDPLMSPNWDMFYLATCMDEDHYPTENVEYSDPLSNGGGSFPIPDGRRRLSRAGYPVCTGAYAVSREGALKLLLKLSVNVNEVIDLKLATMVKDGTILAYTINPPPIGTWKYKQNLGIGGLDSTIHGTGLEAIDEKKKVELKANWDAAQNSNSIWDTFYHNGINSTLTHAWSLITQRKSSRQLAN